VNRGVFLNPQKKSTLQKFNSTCRLSYSEINIFPHNLVFAFRP